MYLLLSSVEMYILIYLAIPSLLRIEIRLADLLSECNN